MKNFVKNSLIFTSSLALGASVGIGGYFIIDYILRDEPETNKSSIGDVDAIIYQNKINDLPKFKPLSQFDKPISDLNNKEVHVNGDAYFNIVEYQYNGKSFLGKEGLKLLNDTINEKLPFGSEFFQLKSISFNNVDALPKDNSVNGQYNPYTMELDIDLRRFIDHYNYSSWTMQQRVDWVYAVLLHEYGHHLANTYITSIKLKSNLNYNKTFYINKQYNNFLASPSSDSVFILKNIPSRFLKSWTESLNYNNEEYSNLEEEIIKTDVSIKKIKIGYTNIDELSDYDKQIILQATSKNLFQAANFPINNNMYNAFSNKNFKGKKYSRMQINYNAWINSINKMVDYSYGMDELLTRHIVSANYIPSNENNYFWLWNKTYNRDGDQINSFGPDILLKNEIVLNSSSTNRFLHDNNIYQADNIFGGYLYGQKINSKVNEFINSYKNIFGYGKLISQIYMNNSNNKYFINESNDYLRSNLSSKDFSKIRIGGYINKNDNIKKIVFKLRNKTTNNQENKEINIIKINSTPLKGKTSPISMQYIESNDNYIQYISDEFDVNEILSNYEIENISFWNDVDNNGSYLNNVNELQNVNSNQIVSERPISTFRSLFEVSVIENDKLYENINSSKSSPYHDSYNKDIYKLEFINGKITFTKDNTANN